MAEKQMTPQQQQMQAHLREKAQRDHEGDIEKWRQKELQAYLDEREKARGIERGR